MQRDGNTTSGNGQAWIRQVPEGSGEQGKMEETGREIVCGALAVENENGLMICTSVESKRT